MATSNESNNEKAKRLATKAKEFFDALTDLVTNLISGGVGWIGQQFGKIVELIVGLFT